MKKPFFDYLLIFILCVIVYSNTINAPFIWDDSTLIIENSRIRDLSNFSDLKGTRYLTFLSFAVNYKIGGYAAAGYHIFNITVHFLNAVLVYLLLIMIFRTPSLSESALSKHSRIVALLSGLLFAGHPVYTLAVTNINQRSVLLATLFYLLSIIMYMKWRLGSLMQDAECRMHDRKGIVHRASWIMYLCSLLSAVFAMKSKEISFTLPFVILLLDRCFFGREWSFKKSVIYALPLFCTLLIIPLDTPQPDVFNRKYVSGVFKIEDGHILSGLNARLSTISRKDYTFTEFRVISTYIRLFFLPINLNLDYDYPIYRTFLNPNVYLPFLFLLSIAGLGVFLFYRSRRSSSFIVHSNNELSAASYERLISFGILWFFITLSIESFIVVLNYAIFEYRLYLPSIGIFLFLTGIAGYAGEHIKTELKYLSVATVIVMVMFSFAAYTRNNMFTDEITVWEDTVKKSPLRADAHNNLGFAYHQQNLFAEAVNEYKNAVQLNPYLSIAHRNLGDIYAKQGLMDASIQEYKIALKIRPDDSSVHNNLGNVYYKTGQMNEAAREYKTALRLKPVNAEAHHNLGVVYHKQGRLNEAVQELKTALVIKPNYLKASSDLGNVYKDMGLVDKAIEQYKDALLMNPNVAVIHNSLGLAYKQKGLRNEAMQEFLTALKLQPNYTEASRSLELLKR